MLARIWDKGINGILENMGQKRIEIDRIFVSGRIRNRQYIS